MKSILALLIIVLTATALHAAPPRSLAGLWVATDNDAVHWLRVTVKSSDRVALLEEVTGTLTTRHMGRDAKETEVPVTGQYLPGSRTVALNIGELGENREYAVGETAQERTGDMVLKVFRMRRFDGINFERTVSFRYRGALPESEPASPTPVTQP